MDIESFREDDDTSDTADVAGDWELSLDFQGQKVPVKLTLEQNDGKVTGTIETALGSGKIESGTVKGKKLDASASTEIQGQSVDFLIKGTIDSDEMSGTLSTAIIPDSLPFEGKRVS
jgi:hypothetical protein